MAFPQPDAQRWVVKQVLSGDTLILRGQPRGGPPEICTVGLSNIQAPRMARRPNPSATITMMAMETKDEPYAWEAREFLRKRVIGKEVQFVSEYTAPGTGKQFGHAYMGKDENKENVAEPLLAEGLVELRRMGLRASEEAHQRLIQIEETAKATQKGKWNEESTDKHVRDVKWTVDNLRHFVDSHHAKPVDAMVEHVRDGCTVRAFLLPNFNYVTVMLSGIKCPMFKDNLPEEFAEEAKFFTESRLLNRDVKIILEGVSEPNLLGTVLHPNGNITELLLREGFARCADWSMGVVSQGPEKLRAAERYAKEKKNRIWKDYQPADLGMDVKEKSYTAKVVEINNGDSLMVKRGDAPPKKIFLSSVRSPRPNPEDELLKKKDPKYRPRPLYDIPNMFEAREFLRKKLIGKKVNIQTDYIQPKSDDFPEKTCCTVTFSNINVAEALVGRGLATVVRYKQDDDKRSSCYDNLLAAEERARKNNVGVHNKKRPLIHVSDVSGDIQKAKQFLPFLQRAGRCEGIIEFVASGSRLRLYIPKETCLITFLLAGIDCPRGSRPAPDRVTRIPADPFGEEAADFTRDLTLQKEVEVVVDSMDKGGNFIGWMFLGNTNLSVSLVEAGLSKVHFTAERSNYYKVLTDAETQAKDLKKKIWENYEEPKDTIIENEQKERQVDYKKVCITEVTDDGHFYAQNVDQGPQLEKLMDQLRNDLRDNPPLTGSYQPRKNDLCAAMFSDEEWYRARVEKVANQRAHVLFVDYGNRDVLEFTRMATLPTSYIGLPPQARCYTLACSTNPSDTEDLQAMVDVMYNDILNKEMLLNAESGDQVTLMFPDTKEDYGQSLISQGLLLVEERRERHLAKLVEGYRKAQDKAKASRLNMWRYGDFTEDDAKEFGYQPRA